MVADDHEESLRMLARILEPEFDITGTAKNCNEALVAVCELKPDVVVLDLDMLFANGLDAARKVFRSLSQVHVIVVAIYSDTDYEEIVSKLGASGFVLKSRAALDLPRAIRNVMLGQTFFPVLTSPHE